MTLTTSQPMLLLDEPTSSLDPSSHSRALQALDDRRGALSLIIVTHRHEPLAHEILRFDGSASVEDGPGVSDAERRSNWPVSVL